MSRHQAEMMKKLLKKLLRVGLLVALFCSCLLASRHLDAYLRPKLHRQHRVDVSLNSKIHLKDANIKHSDFKQTYDVEKRSNHSLHGNGSKSIAVLRATGDCRRVEPWFAKKEWKHVQLIFYGKPIMQAVKRLCVRRHWKMMVILNESNPVNVAELERRASARDTFTIVFTSSRHYHQPVVQRLANLSNALVSSIRYAFKTTGPKKEQLLAFREHFASFGCTLDDVGIMPRSFLLDDSQDCVRFFKYADSFSAAWWVLKSSQGYGGEGISVHQNMSLLYKTFGTCKRNREYIVQEYIFNLLLLEGRKFDVRALVLIAGTNPYFLFYHEGYLRVSVSEFSLKGDRNVHITNSHLQVMSKDYDPEKHFWSFGRFQEYLDAHHPDNEAFVENKLVPFIKNTSLFLLQSSKSEDEKYRLFTPDCEYCLVC